MRFTEPRQDIEHFVFATVDVSGRVELGVAGKGCPGSHTLPLEVSPAGYSAWRAPGERRATSNAGRDPAGPSREPPALWQSPGPCCAADAGRKERDRRRYPLTRYP